uniref:SH3 domain-containing protein n=1 Tax=Anopheles maculatus TaxID=74869 RepID=A0A182SA29_9DIPT
MGPTEEEGCLTFKKGALIHVLRRVDQNWAEGRIADKIGIFPISFVEMNGLAKHMMESSLKHILSNSNRTVPPTPFDLNASATSSSDSSSSVTTSPNSSTSTTSSNSSTAPSSPTAHFLQPQPVASSGGKQHQSKRSDPANREKRHSLTTAGLSTNTGGGALQTNQSAPHRHSTEMLNSDGAGDGKTVRQPVDSAATASSSATATTPYQKCNVTKASQMYQQHPQLPTTYIALYPYKPQKPDELELKKGSIYYVTERCQDGWFKGTNWLKKSGVFPGNYVAIHKGRDGASATSRNTSAHSAGKMNNVSSPQAAGSSASNGGCSSNGAMHSPSNGGSSSPQQQPLQLPELPPRNTTTVPQQQGMKYIDSIFGRQGSIDGGPGSPNNEQQQQQQSAGQDAGAVTTPPATGKVKKDSSAVSLMKRLTNMK